MNIYEIFSVNGSKKFVAKNFAEALKLAIYHKASYLIEHLKLDGIARKNLYVWGNARMLNTLTVKTYFDKDDHIQNILNSQSKEKTIFVYLPHDLGSQEADKRNLIDTKPFKKIKIMNVEDVVRAIGENVYYAYGNGTSMTFNDTHSWSMEKTITKAKENGFGFATVYLPESKRILLLWDAKVLNCEEAQKVAEDQLTKDFIIYCDSVGCRQLVYSNITIGNDKVVELFPLNYFDGAIFI